MVSGQTGIRSSTTSETSVKIATPRPETRHATSTSATVKSVMGMLLSSRSSPSRTWRTGHWIARKASRKLGTSQPFTAASTQSPSGRLTLSDGRSDEHTYDLQSLMRITYAVFCLKKKTQHNTNIQPQQIQHARPNTITNITYNES